MIKRDRHGMEELVIGDVLTLYAPCIYGVSQEECAILREGVP